MKQKIPNTFGLTVFALKVITVTTVEQLQQVWQDNSQNLPIMIIGEGSNSLFTCDFDGIVIVNRIKGMTITETEQAWHLKVGAGEIWHDLVSTTIEQNISGLENLALIPGCVGSAPIQNIGAYGVEFQKVADYVELLELATGKIITVTDGQYGYRESIFKKAYLQGYAVINVGIKLPKDWQPVLTYGELQNFDPKSVTAKIIFDKVCDIRRSKLPDPKVLGNGGSFFKNPVVDKIVADKLLEIYPNMPIYPQDHHQTKLAAGWLIEQCDLKGYQIGGAAVHQQQALVLVNKSHATAEDVVELARFIKKSVLQKFLVNLSPEIRFIGNTGEIDADNYL
ncbi:UDP-N-acetylenolpyruvoylglucosamine reductase [Gilliamella sp. Fer1-1]|jgi:UDP-N-acetylmuramate dehydrogenase|uniref:UDP-N-acetylmuramate dehydrogenase n=1 Tax=unclassified Gilliamella TaxID=2685620 RepID=UPI00080DAAE9|nr:UDP-N-acetylmuramate dehydrogenase [Gilliamella apicola]OCG17771.1 UDP-N-acetylenolpyruvoylglucosamine reductase [Gilliamella apicola]OCG24504.1 UDP-N-acetylenolpyruvoylglucosamine reductase [Gilliamella apicola]OCG27506.1 UDP-N-acetylenolpyruvoylglucosamine reductase [Gilliamella apicola]OCG41372.1 UDP-N-acetylenolpyruvoylglucosamine reductase [Gilliamella apicola]